MSRLRTVELEELRNRLREAEETLAAIRNGEVDSLIVSGPQGDQIFSLRGAEHPYRVFVEQMQEGAITLTTEGTILYANRRFADMLKERLEKVIGSQVQSYIDVADRSELEQILSSPDGRKVRYQLRTADGSSTPVLLAFSRMPLDEIEVICVVVTDLTEEQEKLELATALQNLRVAQEQLQKQNEELSRARAESESASEAKDNFLAALSHELRTPLTPVLMTLEALERSPRIDEEMRQDLLLLRRNVELEARLIDDLLDITRIVRGKIQLKLQTISVHSLLHSALQICWTSIEEKRLQVTQELQARDYHVNGDEVRIQQILWNLIRNAVKFTPSGGRITIRSSNEDGKLRIDVIDNGIGIDPRALERIFNPFEQADGNVTREFGGLGLGLTISKRMTELHGGTLTAHSEGTGKGAAFVLHLPVIAGATEVAAESCHGELKTQQCRPLQILLVEDHDDTRRTLVRLLSRNHHVYDARTIADALAVADRTRFDLLISDLGLPDGSGLDLMRQLRQRYQIKGICLSGFGMEDDLGRSADAGFQHHLTKPVDLRLLERAIESAAG